MPYIIMLTFTCLFCTTDFIYAKYYWRYELINYILYIYLILNMTCRRELTLVVSKAHPNCHLIFKIGYLTDTGIVLITPIITERPISRTLNVFFSNICSHIYALTYIVFCCMYWYSESLFQLYPQANTRSRKCALTHLAFCHMCWWGILCALPSSVRHLSLFAIILLLTLFILAAIFMSWMLSLCADLQPLNMLTINTESFENTNFKQIHYPVPHWVTSA